MKEKYSTYNVSTDYSKFLKGVYRQTSIAPVQSASWLRTLSLYRNNSLV